VSRTEELLEGVRRGDERAFEALFHLYHRKVFALAYQLLGNASEAEDVEQETFLRLFQRPLSPGHEHNVLGWLLRVASNLSYNQLRSRRRRPVIESDEAVEAVDLADPAEKVLNADQADRVRQTLRRLKERPAQLIMLRQAGLSYAELAEALQLNPNSVGTLLARAEQSFRELYRELEEAEHGE
jgi:RNA polymerase sigma-70 factor, ECF subfamily